MSEATYWAMNKDVVKVLRATLAYTDTAAKTLFVLPANCYILDWVVNVTTLFNSSGTDLVDIGITGTLEKFAANIDVATAGLKTTGIVAAEIGILQTAQRIVVASYAQSVADADAGAMVIMVRYWTPNI